MTETKKLTPEIRDYYQKVTELEETLGNKEAAAHWCEDIDPAKAKQLRIEVAEEALQACQEKRELPGWIEIWALQKAGEDEQAKNLIRERITAYERGDIEEGWLRQNVDIAALYEELGEEERARQVLLEHAQNLEKKLTTWPRESQEDRHTADSIEYWALESYKKAEATQEVRRIQEEKLRETEERTGDPDHPFMAFILEELGYTDRAKRAFQKMAEMFEKSSKEKPEEEHAGWNIRMPASLYHLAGNPEKVREILREAAIFEEKHGQKKEALWDYAILRDREAVKRLLLERIDELKEQDNTLELVDALIDLSWLEDSAALLLEARFLALNYASEKERSDDPEDKQNAAKAYKEIIKILQRGSNYSFIRHLWEEHPFNKN